MDRGGGDVRTTNLNTARVAQRSCARGLTRVCVCVCVCVCASSYVLLDGDSKIIIF